VNLARRFHQPGSYPTPRSYPLLLINRSGTFSLLYHIFFILSKVTGPSSLKDIENRLIHCWDRLPGYSSTG
jgi:hypothetical protein